MNARLLGQGGRILLLPDVASTYYARRTLGQVGRMLYQYGYFKPLIARRIGKVLTLRQLAPPAFLLALVAALFLGAWWEPPLLPIAVVAGPYVLLLAGAAAAAARREGGRCALAFAVVLHTMHLGYGLGYLRGTLQHVLRARATPRAADSVALTR
jgi:hypothetical protein